MVLAGAGLLLIIGLVFADESKALIVLLSAVAITMTILLKIVLWHGYVHTTATGLCAIVWLGFTVPVYLFDGIRDAALSGYFVVIAMSGLMLGTKGLMLSASACYLAILGAFYAEKTGFHISTLGPPPDFVDLITVLITVGITALLTGVAMHVLNKMVELSRLSELAVKSKTEELEKKNQRLISEISERRRAEEAIRDSEQKYRQVVEGANSIILRMDTKGRILFFNRYARKFFGFSEQEIIGKSAVGTIIPETESSGRNLADMFLDITVNPNDYIFNENENITKKGQRVWVSWTNRAITDRAGKLIELLSIGIDVTERKKLEVQLRQAQKMESIGTLAGGIAHDFNNILSSIIGFTELALDDATAGSSQEENLLEVYTAGKRARDLVKQILAFARQSDEERKPIYIAEIAKEVLKLIRSTSPATIQITDRIESQARIIGNPTQVHQLILNLCTNAVQALEDTGGSLDVSLGDTQADEQSRGVPAGLQTGHYVRLDVSDNGPGIPPEIIGSIFEPYFTTKGVGKGTGMGLALVHGIVDSYGGKIVVQSPPGQGAMFSVYLPAAEASEDVHLYAKETLPTGTERILLVDDELPIARMGSLLLQSLGYAVTMRTSSVEALELFRSKPYAFDLVITDMTMPNMTGDELARELMDVRYDTPVILFTGYSNKISEERAAEIGIKAFAHKPIVKADLARTVREALDN